MKTLSIDIETYSSVDLAKCGVYKYTEAPDFDILLFGYSVDGSPVQVVDLACGETIPAEIIAALTDTGVTKWAFNAQFERICLSRWLRKNGNFDNTGYSIPEDTVGNYLNPASWKCTMIWSAYMGLPLSLDGVGAVLGLGKQKMTEGKELIKYFCQPCASTKTNGGRTRNLPENAPDKWDSFKRYNIRDVEVEMSIQEKLAKFPVPEAIWNQYHLDQKINGRGVALDMELVHQAIAMDIRSRKELTDAMKKLTALDNPNSVQQMKQWLSDNVVHYGYIEKFIESLGERFNIREIAFDRWGAVQMVQNLEGMGFTVVPFGQGFKDMSPPTKELMKLVLEEKVAHGGHPVLRWMMDNIFIRTDPAGNIKPDKEKSTEKIDGAVATIMALDRAIRCGNDKAESVYDSRGLLFI